MCDNIIKLQDGELVTGPGVRQLLGVRDDSSTEIKPPNYEEHPEWKHVFIQSNGDKRKLNKDTKYLFCKTICELLTVCHEQFIT